ncbi:MAG: TIGR02300 family protein [Alphaproteobacteria bacterium]|nr:TIGR02300 family protein [Alphaproteobacteria bacterium]
MSAVADIRGLKRICTECGIRFYDFNKRPVICPACKTNFTGEVKAKTRRGRVGGTIQKEKIEKIENKNEDLKDKKLIEDDKNETSLDDGNLGGLEEEKENLDVDSKAKEKSV